MQRKKKKKTVSELHSLSCASPRTHVPWRCLSLFQTGSGKRNKVKETVCWAARRGTTIRSVVSSVSSRTEDAEDNDGDDDIRVVMKRSRFSDGIVMIRRGW